MPILKMDEWTYERLVLKEERCVKFNVNLSVSAEKRRRFAGKDTPSKSTSYMDTRSNFAPRCSWLTSIIKSTRFTRKLSNLTSLRTKLCEYHENNSIWISCIASRMNKILLSRKGASVTRIEMRASKGITWMDVCVARVNVKTCNNQCR